MSIREAVAYAQSQSPTPSVFSRRLGHCAILALMLHSWLPGAGPGLALPLAYGATRAITAASCVSHGPHCRLWTLCSVGVVVWLSCGVGWCAAATAYLAFCPRRMLLWPARMTPEEDANAVRRFQAECSLETLRGLPGECLNSKLYHYRDTAYSSGQSWYKWF